MNNIVANFDQILGFAQTYGLPIAQKRAILREYLQVKILDLLYQDKRASALIFVGGTALRLTRTLDRFSEDLDFDVEKQFFPSIARLIRDISKRLVRENIAVDIYTNTTAKRRYFEFRFPTLLFDLHISQQKEEKLMIKFDCESIWRGHSKEAVLVNRYGYLTTVTTIPLSQQLIQKLVAYLRRPQTQPRDIYDLVWLLANGALPDWEFARINGINRNVIGQVLAKFERERTKLTGFMARLRPFLITEQYGDKLDLLPTLLAPLVTRK